MSRRRAALALAFAGCLVAACQADQQSSVTVTRAGVPTAPAFDPPPPVAAIPDPVDSWDDDAEQLAVARPPADLGANPASLRGLASAAVRAALGVPTFRRRDKSAEVWQYYGQGCILDLFLYQEEGQQRVTHYQLRSRDPGTNVDAACYAGLVKR